MHRINRKGHRWAQCWVAPVSLLHMETHHKVSSNCSNVNGNKVHSFWWNKHNILIVSHFLSRFPPPHTFIRFSSFKNYLEYDSIERNLIPNVFHISVASLLSCLHQLRSENIRLEEHVNNLIARRDHLLAVNARLAIPLNQVPQVQNQNSGKLMSHPQMIIYRK